MQSSTRAPHLIGLATTAVGATLLLAGCGGQPRSAVTATHTDESATPAQVVTVRASEFKFADGTIRVPVNARVRLVMSNEGVIEHDLRIANMPATDVHMDGGPRTAGDGHGHKNEVTAHAAAGKQAWVEFTPSKKGSYEIDCTFAGHKDAGMKGTLIVE